MNSNFTLKDDEDLMSYDFGAQHFSNDEALKSLNETCGFSDVHIFIQPSVRRYLLKEGDLSLLEGLFISDSGL